MGFLDFLFGTNRKTDMKDDSLFGPTDTAPTNLIEMDEEFSEDLVKDNLDTPFFKEDKSYLQNGVHMENAQNTFKLVYDGLLAQNGSNEIHAVVGYGNNLNWEDIEEHKMDKTKDNKFELMLTVKRPGNINIAFKDNAQNWDNNSGHNYNFENYLY
jgi:hypothetical protein